MLTLEGCNGRQPGVELRPECVLGFSRQAGPPPGAVPDPRGGRRGHLSPRPEGGNSLPSRFRGRYPGPENGNGPRPSGQCRLRPLRGPHSSDGEQASVPLESGYEEPKSLARCFRGGLWTVRQRPSPCPSREYRLEMSALSSPRCQRSLGFGVALGVAVLLLGPVGAASATTFNVNTTTDGNHGSCGTTPGSCSLRDAIIAANAGSGGDTINVPPGTYDLTLTGAGEDMAATVTLLVMSRSPAPELGPAGRRSRARAIACSTSSRAPR